MVLFLYFAATEPGEMKFFELVYSLAEYIEPEPELLSGNEKTDYRQK